MVDRKHITEATDETELDDLVSLIDTAMQSAWEPDREYSDAPGEIAHALRAAGYRVAPQPPEGVAELIAEAEEFTDGWERSEEKRAWRPFDQADRIRHWVGSWQTDEQRAEFDADVRAWEDVHAHDVRLKCYPEFGCAVIESYAADLVIRLVSALSSVPPVRDTSDEELMAAYHGMTVEQVRNLDQTYSKGMIPRLRAVAALSSTEGTGR